MYPVCLQPGVGGEVAGVVAGAATGHLQRHLEDAHRVEAGRGDGVVGGASKGPLQESLRQLQGAFERFWRTQAGYPQFKRKGQSKDSATYFSNCFSYRGGQLRLAKQSEPLEIRWSRPLPEGVTPSQVTVSRNARGQYHISILVEDTISELEPTDRVVGLDAGITSLYTLSTGEKITNAPRAQGP